MADGATVTPIVTNASGALVSGTPVAVTEDVAQHDIRSVVIDTEPPITCARGKVKNGACVCPRTHKPVKAGESFQYEFQLPPDHPSGVYHYHPHLHGASHNQVFGGMMGAIIIEGELDRLPGIDGVPERMLILQTTQLTPDGGRVISVLNAFEREQGEPGFGVLARDDVDEDAGVHLDGPRHVVPAAVRDAGHRGGSVPTDVRPAVRHDSG